MKKRLLKSLITTLTLLISGPLCHAAYITTYTDPTAFAAALQPGSFTDNYSNFGPGVGLASYSNSNSTYGYSASAVDPNGGGVPLYGISTITPALFGTNFPEEALTLTMTTGNVTAVGGYFYNTDVNNSFIADPVSLTLNYGSGLSETVTFTPTSISGSFFGFTFDNATTGGFITSIVENAPSSATDYASVSTFTVGAVVPEPSSIVLSGLAGLCALAYRAIRVRRPAPLIKL